MRRVRLLLEDIMLVLWFGSLWTAGLLVAPLLFQLLPRALAATVAGQLFQYSHWIGIFSSVLLMGLFWQQQQRTLISVIGILLLLVLLNLLWVMPQVALLRGAADHTRFVMWHSISSAIYLLECLGAVWVLWLRRVAACR